jgi:glycosyltransferase involved in cell wall biosynthesis
MKPRVSVIIPTYNRAIKVRSSIQSVLRQTFSDLEVIVVDDGSSDGTGKVLGEIYGDRIRYYFQVNHGVSVARNKGIQEARGEWIAFLDSDDLWEEDKLEWQFKALERFGPECDACYTDTRLYNHTETRTLFQMAQDNYRHDGRMGVNTEILRLLVRPGGAGMVVCISSLLARADPVRRTGGFSPKLKFSEESEFMFRLAAGTGFCYVNLPLVSKDQSPPEIRHVGVSTNWDRSEFILQQSQVRLEGLRTFSEGMPANLRNLIREQLSSVHSGLVNCYLELGEYGKAREAASRAARLNPRLTFAVKCLLTWISPQLARETVRRHQERRKDSFTV